MNAPQDFTAKATFPPANPWRESGLTRAQAEARAKWFVREWRNHGLPTAKAAVFYRDGSLCFEAHVGNCDGGAS